MSKIFAAPLGALMRFVFEMVEKIGNEPKSMSFYALTIIITTIIFKFLLLPIAISMNRSMEKMNDLNPKMKEIQNKYKNDPQTQSAKLAQLYKENKVNPASSCLPLIVQMVILFAFFAVMRDPVQYVFKDKAFYDALSKNFLWIKNLEQPDPFLWGTPLIVGLTTYFQSVTTPNQAAADPQTKSTQRTMNIFLPLMLFWFARSFSAGLGLYWVVSNIFQIIQQLISKRSLDKAKGELK